MTVTVYNTRSFSSSIIEQVTYMMTAVENISKVINEKKSNSKMTGKPKAKTKTKEKVVETNN